MRARPIRLRGLRFPFAASLRVTWWGEPPHSCFPRHLELPACKGKKAKCDFAFFEYCLERQRSCLPPWGKVSAKPTEEGRSLLSGHPARRGARVRTLCAVMSAYSCLPPWGKVSAKPTEEGRRTMRERVSSPVILRPRGCPLLSSRLSKPLLSVILSKRGCNPRAPKDLKKNVKCRM